MILHSKQAQVASDAHRFRVVNFGRKSGKTELSIEEIIGFASLRRYTHGKRPKISYIGETRKEAKRIAWDRAKLRTKPIWAKDPNESNLELYLRNNSLNLTDGNYSTVYFDGWENIEALVGEEFDFLSLDEVAKFRNFWVGWQEILRPTLGPRKGHALFISRPQGFNHWFDLCNFELIHNSYKTYHATAYDNPHVDITEIDEARSELTEDRFAQEYLAEFRKKEGLVYKEFSRDQHLYKPELLSTDLHDAISNPRLRIAGIDFGFTNPSAVIAISVDRTDTYWITDEWYKTGKTDAEVAEYVAGCRFSLVYPDPESPAAIAELKKNKVNVRDVVKGKDSVRSGIDKVRELLKSGKLRIAAHCVNTISEFEMYSYPEQTDKRYEEDPIDEHNHALDALRYAVMMTMIRPASTGQARQWKPRYH